ncbi:MAG: hypothetical protein GXO99_06585 [Nitrospirae bacterium]|nr:hypothetical protein [Nitrospirota bacterium]
MLLAIITYIVLLIVYVKGVFYIKILLQGGQKRELYLPDRKKGRWLILSIFDVLFLRRLFRVNKLLWIGEWLFHISFVFVVLSHLRFILNFLPSWWSHLVCIGKYAGVVMTISMLYILTVRASIDYKRYISPGNLLLILLIFFIGLSGLLLRYTFRVDVIAVKAFMLGVFGFSPQPAPEHGIFIFHYLLVLLLLIYLPSHILTAPITTSEARKREYFVTYKQTMDDEKIY